MNNNLLKRKVKFLHAKIFDVKLLTFKKRFNCSETVKMQYSSFYLLVHYLIEPNDEREFLKQSIIIILHSAIQ